MLPDPAGDERLFLRPAAPSDGAPHEPDTFHVCCRGKRVGYVLHSTWYGTRECPWVWGIDGTKITGMKTATREEAMAAFRKAWDAAARSHDSG